MTWPNEFVHPHSFSDRPPHTPLQLDFHCVPSVNQKAFLALADNSAWVHQANNVILFGPSAVGKTHLACAIGYRLIEQGVRVLFTSTTALVQKLQEAKQQFRLPDTLAKLERYPLLILDDIGYVTALSKTNEPRHNVMDLFGGIYPFYFKRRDFIPEAVILSVSFDSLSTIGF